MKCSDTFWSRACQPSGPTSVPPPSTLSHYNLSAWHQCTLDLKKNSPGSSQPTVSLPETAVIAKTNGGHCSLSSFSCENLLLEIYEVDLKNNKQVVHDLWRFSKSDLCSDFQFPFSEFTISCFLCMPKYFQQCGIWGKIPLSDIILKGETANCSIKFDGFTTNTKPELFPREGRCAPGS